MSDFKIVKLLDPISLTLTGPNFEGEYASGTTYQAGMSVSYNGSSYVALQTTTGNVPTNTTYWQLLAAKGDTGAGSVSFTCRNSTGTPIQAFRVVYISGSTGNEPNITLAQGNNDPNSSKTFGVTPLVINNNSNGTVVHSGEIDNINTSAFAAGNLLWLSPTTPGLVTTTRPPAPDHGVFIGYVVRAHPTQGKIIVTIQNGFELQELHNVLINGITNGQVIQYESATQLWKNHTLTKTDVGLENVPNTDATNPANIIQTASYRFSTDAEKSTWNGKQNALGFTPEDVANKSTNTSLGTSDILYPSQKAVKNYVDTAISGATIPDATTLVKGKIKLAGDLAGTADLPTVPGLSGKEPTITAGTTSQYWRGDKTFQTLDKSAVGLPNVDNTSDNDKPISSATSTALSGKEPTITVGTSSQYWRGDKTFQTLDKSAVGLGNVPNTDATNPANISQTASYRFVTDTEKSTWNGKQDALGFTPEDVANKSTNTSLGTSDTLYPSQNAVKSYADNALSSKVSYADMQKTSLAYVSPSGSNTTGDGSFARPYLTIAHTIANTLDGATIFLLPGLYTESTIAIPATTGSRSFRGFSANSTEIQNGIIHTSGAVNTGFTFDSININSATLNESSAINGFIYFTRCWFSITRNDSNVNVVFTSTESNISSGTLSGATNIFNEALVIGAITCSGGFNIFENCKFVTTVEAQGSTTVRMLDCELFGTSDFINGTIVSGNTPSWEIDLATDYLGGYTGSINKTKLASITSSMVSDIAIQASGLMNVPFYSKLSTLTDATNISTDVSQGNIFSVTLTGNRNLSAPTGMTSSRQRATWIITQDATGGRLLTYDSSFNFGVDLIGVSISSDPNATSYIGAMYNPTTSKWDVISILRGY
jgi:hypothetical protein